jgi:succinate dehydrogenase / fumarate reductase membrane anchor subunit
MEVLMRKNFKETSKTGAVSWLLQRISAVIVFVLLMIHFYTYHFLSQGKAVTYEQVVAKVSSWWFPLFQFIFLVTALYHGMNGVWAIVEDYPANRYARLFFYSVLFTAAVAFFFIGTLTIVKAAMLKVS